MSAKIVIRVRPNDSIEVKVEGLTEPKDDVPPGKKLCERVTRRLERDLGQVVQRRYENPDVQDSEIEVHESEQQENLHD